MLTLFRSLRPVRTAMVGTIFTAPLCSLTKIINKKEEREGGRRRTEGEGEWERERKRERVRNSTKLRRHASSNNQGTLQENIPRQHCIRDRFEQEGYKSYAKLSAAPAQDLQQLWSGWRLVIVESVILCLIGQLSFSSWWVYILIIIFPKSSEVLKTGLGIGWWCVELSLIERSNKSLG